MELPKRIASIDADGHERAKIRERRKDIVSQPGKFSQFLKEYDLMSRNEREKFLRVAQYDDALREIFVQVFLARDIVGNGHLSATGQHPPEFDAKTPFAKTLLNGGLPQIEFDGGFLNDVFVQGLYSFLSIRALMIAARFPLKSRWRWIAIILDIGIGKRGLIPQEHKGPSTKRSLKDIEEIVKGWSGIRGKIPRETYLKDAGISNRTLDTYMAIYKREWPDKWKYLSR